jgi:hypothetical protein
MSAMLSAGRWQTSNPFTIQPRRHTLYVLVPSRPRHAGAVELQLRVVRIPYVGDYLNKSVGVPR